MLLPFRRFYPIMGIWYSCIIFDKRPKGKALSSCLHDKSFLSVSSLLPLTGREIFGLPKFKAVWEFWECQYVLFINCERQLFILETASNPHHQHMWNLLRDTVGYCAAPFQTMVCVCHAQSRKAGLKNFAEISQAFLFDTIEIDRNENNWQD